MSDPNPLIRSRALEHFRKTVGLEGSGGVQVNVNQQTALIRNGPHSDLLKAIDAHASPGSEAFRVIELFHRLTASQKQDILNLLRSL